MEEHASSFVEKVHMEEDQAAAEDTSVSEVAKSLYDELGEESNEPEDSDPVRDEYQENYLDGKDIAIHIYQSVQESSHGT